MLVYCLGKPEGDGGEMFKAICKLGLEGIVSQKLNSPYRSGRTKSWIKVKNPNGVLAIYDQYCIFVISGPDAVRAKITKLLAENHKTQMTE